MLIFPPTLASTTTSRWKISYIDVLIALGAVGLMLLPVYEKFIAQHQLISVSYFKNQTIVFSILLIAIECAGCPCTHTHLYAWSNVAYNSSTRDSAFYIYTNGVTQCPFGIVAGIIMLKTRRFKWLLMAQLVSDLLGMES